MKLIIIILLMAIIIVETIGAVLLNKAGKNGNNLLLVLGIIAYIFVAILFYWLVKTRKEYGNCQYIMANCKYCYCNSHFILYVQRKSE